jgi:hypothetical protein
MRNFGRVIGLAVPLATLALATLPPVAHAQVICAANVSAPPELPVYEQPPIPAPGYIWTPGYWSSGNDGYFWVPGTWVEPPRAGLLWTPGYWGWHDGIYIWNAGYWGPHVGFYGGVNYGFGYGGVGFEGGRWENGVFAYNRTVTNFGSITITNVYEKTVVVEPNASRVSFNGGTGGVAARPTAEEEAAAHEDHVMASPAQKEQERTASTNTALLASTNHGRPAIAATVKPGEFTGKGVVAAREETKVPTATPKTPNAEVRPSGTEAKLPNAETKPVNTETRPPNAGPKPAGTEAKLPNAETKPANIEARPARPELKPTAPEAKPSTTETKPPSTEAKLPNAEAKPHEAAPPRAPSASPAPQVANKPAAKPAPPPAHQNPPSNKDKDKKPPA